ncbi:aminodeoxychorismate synthase component I [Clostridium akagii]|uniref:aminodeoxychorismate synthase component I n=1 Tax=Clostridium akagii TaxID=91623 RepID=UPI00047DD8B5|nr:aminodeoxychorismate synthase component I [Clostridium akagii]
MKVILEKIVTKLEPFELYSVFKEEINTVFLDSGRDYEIIGRYSFIGVNPFITIKEKAGIVWIDGVEVKGDIFYNLQKILQKYKIENYTEIPFIAGGIGYLAYDLGREIEVLPSNALDDVIIPQVYYNFYDNLIIIDNLKKQTFVSALGILNGAMESIEDIRIKIRNGKEVEYKSVTKIIKKENFKSNFTKEKYLEAVDKVINYIKNGDIYVMNLTQRFHCDYIGDSYELYKDLRNISPAPFSAYMKLEGFEIACSSPERFLNVANKIANTRPIKGTRPRGTDPEQDDLLIQELKNSEKEKSELLMIVDLERNDLSKVCQPNSVKVTELYKIETYSTVHHLVANITGRLKDQYNVIDCIKACFPGGSITGAPKIRSMEIIEELEDVRRNLYTGCIGYLGFDESTDLNIVIRTIHLKQGKAYFGVGGGITYESEREFEYEETLQKGIALMRVLSNGED